MVHEPEPSDHACPLLCLGSPKRPEIELELHPSQLPCSPKLVLKPVHTRTSSSEMLSPQVALELGSVPVAVAVTMCSPLKR